MDDLYTGLKQVEEGGIFNQKKAGLSKQVFVIE